MKLYRSALVAGLLGLSISGYAADIKNVTASSFDQASGHAPKNLIDNNVSTRWAASGKNNWVLVEFTKEDKITNIVINAFKSEERLLTFSISYSSDGKTWTDIPGQYETSAVGNKLAEKFIFDKPIKAKYIRLNTFGTNVNNWSAINELSFNSSEQLPTQQIK